MTLSIDKPQSATRESLTHERVVAAALQIVDRDGLDKLSMRRLGAELGVDPMAVYYYIPNKAALLDGLIDAVMTELGVPEPRQEGEPVADWFVRAFGDFMETLRQHRNVLTVMAQRPVTGEAGMRAAECVLRELRAIGLPPNDSMAALSALTTMTISLALMEASRDPETMDPSVRQKVEDFYQSLPPEEFPLVLDAITRPCVSDWGFVHEFSIRTMIAGLIATYGG